MRVDFNPDHAKARAFFSRILSHAPVGLDVRLIVVAHIVDSAIPFIPALDSKLTVQAILGKPSSIQPSVRLYLSGPLPTVHYELDKVSLRSNPESFINESFPESKIDEPIPVVILDIGGYFAPGINNPNSLEITRNALQARGYALKGIVEDTENGHKRYANALTANDSARDIQIYSVARSPLKRPENHLVGVAVTFSIEALLRKSNIVLQSRRSGVIGFGQIGSSVAHSLRNRGIDVSICDLDPLKLAAAAAQGFRVYHYEHHFEDFARGLNLIVSATGAGADEVNGKLPINPDTVKWLDRGTFIASVTSADDEIDLELIKKKYRPSVLSYNEDVSKWTDITSGDHSPHYFYLMLNGNAVNFRHEGVVGPAIQLLQGEIIACVNKILSQPASVSSDKVQELDDTDRKLVANTWLDHYMTDSAVID